MAAKGGFRWFVIALLFYITVANYIDRSAIAFAISDIKAELGLGPSEIGLILGAFGLGYAITTFLGGIAVDRWGARAVLLVAAVLWTASIGVTGFAGGFLTLYVARTVLGVAEGPNFPALTGAVSRWLAPHERAIALGNTLVAVPLALAIGAPVVTQLIHAFGWRGMFFALTALSGIWVPLWLIFFRNDPEQSSFVGDAELKHIRGGVEAARDRTARHVRHGFTDWRLLLTNRTLLANYWAFFVFGYFLFFFMTWLPNYLAQTYKSERPGGRPVRHPAVGLRRGHAGGARLSFRLSAGAHRAAADIAQHADRRHPASGGARGDPGRPSSTACRWRSPASPPLSPSAWAPTPPITRSTSTSCRRAPRRRSASWTPASRSPASWRRRSPAGWSATFGSFQYAFLLMAGLALSSVLVVLIFHRPDEDRADQPLAVAQAALAPAE